MVEIKACQVPRCYKCDKAIVGGETIVGIDVSIQPGTVMMSPHCWECALLTRRTPPGGDEATVAVELMARVLFDAYYNKYREPQPFPWDESPYAVRQDFRGYARAALRAISPAGGR